MKVSVKEAARILGISQQTVRRRIKRGDIPAQKVPRPQGFTYRVDLPDEVIDQVKEATASRDATPDQVSGTIAEALALIGKLQEENRDLAHQVGMWQERATNFQKLLEAPRLPWWRRLLRR